MATEKKFLVVKNKDDKTIKYFEYNKIKGYQLKPKNTVKFEDAINVDKMILINPTLIEKMDERRLKENLNSWLILYLLHVSLMMIVVNACI